jgi:predicted nucleotide-binding protein
VDSGLETPTAIRERPVGSQPPEPSRDDRAIARMSRQDAATVIRLHELAQLCADALGRQEIAAVKEAASQLIEASLSIGRAWCGSWWGYHSRLYVTNFRPQGPGDDFNTSWGVRLSRGGPWIEYDYAAVRQAILTKAGVDVSAFDSASAEAERVCTLALSELTPILDSLSDSTGAGSLQAKQREVHHLQSQCTEKYWQQAEKPPTLPMAGDERALSEGIVTPLHIAFKAQIAWRLSFFSTAERLVAVSQYVAKYVERHQTPLPSSGFGDAKAIFLIHGQNDVMKENVAAAIESVCKLRPTILHEQPDGGKTIIEKLEHYSAQVYFAVALLTADDRGGAEKKLPPGLSRKQAMMLTKSGRLRTELRPRARQNVILELGYFWGKLGRERVVILYEDGVELPSDALGILYKPLDAKGEWRTALAKELTSAGVAE